MVDHEINPIDSKSKTEKSLDGILEINTSIKQVAAVLEVTGIYIMGSLITGIILMNIGLGITTESILPMDNSGTEYLRAALTLSPLLLVQYCVFFWTSISNWLVV
ncbi:MAG: hypothetical protein ACFFE8_09045 [Candidatus Heimdallarchaeota archaeon]